MVGGWDTKEGDFPQVLQAVLLGLGFVLCAWALARAGRAGGDWHWWVAPAFICFFMCWRETEIDEILWGENAFSWKYLWGDGEDLPVRIRWLLGVPSIALALTVLVICAGRARLLLATLRRRDLRIGVLLFVGGIGLYLVGQVYDKYADHLPGIRVHRDDYWEEMIELAGAAAVLMGVLDGLVRRPIIRRAAAWRAAPPVAVLAPKRASIRVPDGYTAPPFLRTAGPPGSGPEARHEPLDQEEHDHAVVSDAPDSRRGPPGGLRRRRL
jgi:hypothetical protein